MLFIKELQVENYKNIESVSLKADKKFICFTGENGAGKTNLIDSIHYLSLGKSYFSNIETQNIRFNQNYFHLKSVFHRNEQPFKITCGYMKGDKKVIKKNGEAYSRFSEHVGEFPVVMITPYDIELIHGGSEERRRFLDILISQTDKTYLENLMSFVKILKQRNAHLKFLSFTKSNDKKLIQIYNEQLCRVAEPIFLSRKEFINDFRKVFHSLYSKISGAREDVGMTYISQLNENSLAIMLERCFYDDIKAERTSYGPHKDDIDLIINERPVKKFGSQGQQKSFLLALKLAEYETIRKKKGFMPLLLLDDIFDKLDAFRISQMMGIISGSDYGQTFITDTDRDRVEKFFHPFSSDLSVFHVDKGSIV